jgi:nucleoside-diphosphate-sugar epimerase
MDLYLITGVNGFIGSHVARRILREGHRVRGLVRTTSRLNLLEGLDIELVYGDISRPETLEKAAQGVDRVIHLAGRVSDWGPYEDFYKVNFQGTRDMALAAEKAGVKRLVHISTAVLHGFGCRDIDESFPMSEKLIHYGQTKKMAEKWLFEFARTAKMEIAVIRPGNVYGPNDHVFIDKYLEVLYKGRMAYVNKGRALTCPVFIDNLVEGIRLACYSEQAAGEAFIITDGLEITWREFTEKLAEALRVKKPRLSVPFGLAYFLALIFEGIFKLSRRKNGPSITRYRVSNGGRDYHFSIAKARKFLNYHPVIDLDQAVKRTVDWYVKTLAGKTGA